MSTGYPNLEAEGGNPPPAYAPSAPSAPPAYNPQAPESVQQQVIYQQPAQSAPSAPPGYTSNAPNPGYKQPIHMERTVVYTQPPQQPTGQVMYAQPPQQSAYGQPVTQGGVVQQPSIIYVQQPPQQNPIVITTTQQTRQPVVVNQPVVINQAQRRRPDDPSCIYVLGIYYIICLYIVLYFANNIKYKYKNYQLVLDSLFGQLVLLECVLLIVDQIYHHDKNKRLKY